MRNIAFLITAAALFIGGGAAIAAPIPSAAAVTATASDDGLIVKTASHSHKNMKRVHKAQGGGSK